MTLLLPKNFFKNTLVITFIALISAFLSACVTQEYKADNTPVIENPVSQNEIAMTRIQLGLGYLKMGNTTQAKLNLEKAKRISPNLVQVYTAFAHYYDQVGEVDLAINAYEKALAIKDDDADTLNNYGVFLCSQNRVDEAEKQLLKAIAVPSYLLVSQSYENIALCQLKVNRFVKAEQYLKKAIEHSPNNASALVQMAQLQYAKKDYLKAEKYLKRFEKVTRKFNPVPLALAYKVYRKQGKNKDAKNYAAMLVKMFPQSKQSKQYLRNGLAHIEADTLAANYRQSLLAQQPKKTKKRVIKLSPHRNKEQSQAIANAYKTPFKVKSELTRLPISRSVKPEEPLTTDENIVKNTKQINNEATEKKTTLKKADVSANASSEPPVISDEMMAELINDTDIAKPVVKNTNKAVVEKPKEASDKLVNNDIETDLSSDDSVDDDITTPNLAINKAVIEPAVDKFVVTDVSDNTTASESDNSDEDATDKAIDEAINNLVADDVNDNTPTKTNNSIAVNDSESLSSIEPLTHVVKQDQNLFYISRTYNIRLSALRRWNNLTKNSVLQVGDVIYLTDPASIKKSTQVQTPHD